MKSLLLAFLSAFTLVGTLSVITSGCGSGENCGSTPNRPAPQAPLGNLRAYGLDAMVNQTPPPITPENGTLEVTGEQVVIRYRQADIDYRVEYRVVGPR